MTAVVGDRFELALERVAHGGTCVGRHDGQVVFARYGIPGERVRVVVTSIGSGGRFVRADVTDVLVASPDRIAPRCAIATPDGCGGCDWQHVALQRQRALKAEVIREQFVRVAKFDAEHPLLTNLVVEPCGDDDDGFGYRTRMDFVGDTRGRLGLRGARSHEVIAVRDCALAAPAITASEAMRQPWGTGVTVRFAASHSGLAVTPEGGDAAVVTELVGDVAFEVSSDGFWQVHRNAARVFTDTAAALLRLQPGEFLLDLYGGVGLFARMLAPVLGAGGRLLVVESDRRAGRLAKRNLRGIAAAEVIVDRVDRWLQQRELRHVDAVVLDPPRTGAGKSVMDEVSRLRPSRMLYVACDPASLARDVALAADRGYRLTALRAIDAFPHTGHVETFALLTRD